MDRAEKNFNNLLLEAMPGLLGYAISITRNRSDGEDLAQQTAWKALRGRRLFEPGTNFKGWLFHIARNEWISVRRAAARKAAQSLDELSEVFLTVEGQQETVTLMDELLARARVLPPGQGRAVLLICGAGMSYREAEAAMQSHDGTMKGRLYKARKALREFAEHSGSEIERVSCGE